MSELSQTPEPDSAPVRIVKGSKQRLVPFARDTERESAERGFADFELRLMRVGINEPKQIAVWAGALAARRVNDWADDVLDQAKDATEQAGTRCEFALEAVVNNEVRKRYGLVLQPAQENLSPSAEGLVHLSMRQQNNAINQLLNERQATVEVYKDTIRHMREEMGELRLTIRSYQARENEYREREMRLLDRESALRMREVESLATRSDREEERFDRIGDKLIEALETLGSDAVQAAVERLEPGDVKELVEKYGPLVAKVLAGAN